LKLRRCLINGRVLMALKRVVVLAYQMFKMMFFHLHACTYLQRRWLIASAIRAAVNCLFLSCNIANRVKGAIPSDLVRSQVWIFLSSLVFVPTIFALDLMTPNIASRSPTVDNRAKRSEEVCCSAAGLVSLCRK